jgi:hypothetical protein
VIHAHRTAFAGVLSGGLAVRGTIYPSIPDYSSAKRPNVIRMRISAAGRPLTHGYVTLTSRMTDMYMVPVHATARPRAGTFVGRLLIPMFGAYRVDLQLHSGGSVHRGHVDLPLGLSIGR